MTIGSAASLSRFPLFNAVGPLEPEPAPAQAVPPAGRRLALAASDPPHGRILVVESQAIIALDLQRILREAGYRVVGPAASLEEVGPLLRRGRVDCAVADVDPVSGELPAIAELLDSAGVPLVVLGGGHGLAGRPTLDKPYTPPELLEAIETAIAGPAPEMPAPSSASAPRLPWPRVFPSL